MLLFRRRVSHLEAHISVCPIPIIPQGDTKARSEADRARYG